MSKEFNCPSCSAVMTFEGGESIFQTCGTCHAPIVVPSDIFYPKEMQIASENFATLIKDVAVDVDEVTNQLTPGDSLPNEKEVIDPEAMIEKFEVYQEKIGTGSVKAKNQIDSLISEAELPGNTSLDERPDSLPPVSDAGTRVMERIRQELRTGDKIEAIKIYRETFGETLQRAKEIIDAIEKKEFSKSQGK